MTRASAEHWGTWFLAALWATCAISAAATIQRNNGFPPFFLAPGDSGAAPIVRDFRSPRLGGSSGELRRGDRLLRIADIDVHEFGPARVFVRFVGVARAAVPLQVTFERDGVRQTTTVIPGSVRILAPLLLAAPVFAVVAFLLRRRAAKNASARAFSLALANLAFFLAANFAGPPALTYAAIALHSLTTTLLGPLLVYAFLLFPDRNRLRRSERRWPWVFAVLGILHTAHLGAPVPPRSGTAAAALVVVALLATCAALATKAYRRSGPLGRRRVKWLLFGTYAAVMPVTAAAIASVIEPRLVNIYFASLTAVVFLPLALLIAIMRVNLFDVDRVVSTVGSYNLVIGLAFIIGATVLPRAAQAGADLLGISSDFGRVGLSALLGMGVYFAHGQLRPRIERVFFAERYALDTGVHDLVARMRVAENVEALACEMADTLVGTIRPASCVVYALKDDEYVPLVARTPAAPPSLPAAGPLLATVRDRRAPLAAENGGEPIVGALDPFESASLEALNAEVVVPIRRGENLDLLLCLGAKRSGDIYTPTDIKLLRMVGETAGFCLDRFAQTAVIEQTKQMRDSLRRFVPVPLAEAMDLGHELEPVEREITVMFVDLRGYTSLCEIMAPQQVHDLTERYTTTVSRVLRRHGGAVVEFSGDGLMALFGAPQALAEKERASVLAAFELVDALHAHGPRQPDGTPLAVGIGIATGPASCGSIRSADHLIWTAVGDIVNLAARLQSLTREIDRLIAIDETTFARAGSIAANFKRSEPLCIRGRRQAQVVYSLATPLRASAA